MASLPDSRPGADGLVLRTAVAADLAQLGSWNRQLIEDERHDNPMSVEELVARMRAWLLSEYQAVLFEAGPAPVGYALFRQTPEWIHLRQFFIARDCRRCGIGARAVALLRDTVFPPGKLILVEAMVWNDAALSFWRSLGFADRYVGLESGSSGCGNRSSRSVWP